jgi:selenocysteine-specific elongation factor
MARLEAALSVAMPPPLAEAARVAGCPPEGIRLLESGGRLVRLEADLAWSTSTYANLASTALALARRGPLTPAAFRDATGSSRRFALAILEDLGRRGILSRTDAGHVVGPRAPRPGTST